ncbi:hypothetical protein K8R33_02670 [archaeon]|nr:hypothetical protein [archaeon]
MSYLTPLELSLETELARVGLPFLDRDLITDYAVNDFLSRQGVSRRRLDMVADPKLIKIFKKFLDEGIELDDFLIHRHTRRNMRGYSVIYNVFPSEEDEERLRAVTDYDQLEPVLGNILRERTFFTETIKIEHESNALHIPQEVRDGVEKEIYECPNLTSRLNVQIPEESEMPIDRGLFVDFYSDYTKAFVGEGYPSGILNGIASPIDNAHTLSRRIANFMQQTNS